MGTNNMVKFESDIGKRAKTSCHPKTKEMWRETGARHLIFDERKNKAQTDLPSTMENHSVSPYPGGRSKRLAASDSDVSADPGRPVKRRKTAMHEKIFTQVSVFSRPSDF
jgi:hypothetical protein